MQGMGIFPGMTSSATLLGLLLTIVQVNGQDPGPWVNATKGEPWPMPSERQLQEEYYQLNATSFKFQIMGSNCDVLRKAVERYTHIIKKEVYLAKQYGNVTNDKVPKIDGSILALKINSNQACEHYPNLGSDESYDLNIPEDMDNTTATLSSNSAWGILRGLETFSQLLIPLPSGLGLVIRSQKISDKPRFPHRGLLLDTSRHFIPVGDILLTLDAMSYNKMNVLHWHIVDDNSFPYVSTKFPELSTKGAYHSSMVYKPGDVREIIEYARLRGIRVVPEFDTPGHTKSWGVSHPKFLTQCYGDYGPNGKLGPMNPLSEELYKFLESLLGEVSTVFPDKYLHLGGDEVDFDCWRSNPEINSYMERNNIAFQYNKVEELFVRRVLDIAANLSTIPVVWQEVFDNGLNLRQGTVVHVWTGFWTRELFKVTRAGYPAILSACWYLDHIGGGGDWLKYYNCEPLSFYGSEEQNKLILGGEACMWSEHVDKNNIHPRIWPRASATAEILWSPRAQDETTAAKRLQEHACRMNRRGIPAQPPNGPGFCLS